MLEATTMICTKRVQFITTTIKIELQLVKLSNSLFVVQYLGAIGARTSIGHGEQPLLRVLQLEILVRKLGCAKPIMADVNTSS